MRRVCRVGLAVSSVVGLLVVGSSVASAGVDSAKAVPVEEWSASVCKGFSRWDVRLSKLASSGALADATAGKTAITKFLTGTVKANARLARDLKAAGVPAVKNGKAIAAAFVTSAKRERAAFAQAKTAASALPTDDQAAFATAAKQIATQLQTAGTSLNATLETTAGRYPSSGLDNAFKSTKACKAIA